MCSLMVLGWWLTSTLRWGNGNPISTLRKLLLRQWWFGRGFRTLTYGHDAVLPMEITVKFLRVAYQNNLTPGDYNEAMFAELDSLDEMRLLALDHIRVHKMRIARAYNKKVKPKSFEEGKWVWKTIYLLIQKKGSKAWKMVPNLGRPFCDPNLTAQRSLSFDGYGR